MFHLGYHGLEQGAGLFSRVDYSILQDENT